MTRLKEAITSESGLGLGYVRLVDHMGSDLTVVNSARVSYDKEVDVLGSRDENLIRYLAEHGHTSPFRHGMMQFEVYAPLMIARQWWKYVVGAEHTQDAWNESSRRYISESEEFYIPNPNEWRRKPASSKQGSGDFMSPLIGEGMTEVLVKHIDTSETLYKQALSLGIAPEQARLFLPAYSMYVRWYWTGSLQSIAHLIQQREASDAQFEFQQYAKIVRKLAEEKFPVAMKHLLS